MLSFICFLAHDASLQDPDITMQQKLMLAFFGKQDTTDELWLDQNFCGWRGIECTNLKITTVNLAGFAMSLQYDKLQYTFLPPTVRFLTLTWKDLKSRYDSRLLPRALESGNLDFTRLFGTFQFDTLPTHLVSLSMRKNDIRGPISVLRMPSSVRRINLESNPILNVIVCAEELPEGLEEVLFGKIRKGPMTKIKWVDGLKDKRIVVNASRVGF